jgi:hypothetical protein
MRPAFEVADIFRRHGTAYRADHAGSLSLGQRRIMAAIEACRTAVLGGHIERCEDCGETRIAYNSCRNRHCPKCQGLARAQWLADRQAELPPVPYFHLVFTVPAPIARIALQNKAVVYDILFRVTAETVQSIAADPKHLGAAIGMTAVLHTWGQNLFHHPHVHCIVPGGGLSPEGRWIAWRPASSCRSGRSPAYTADCSWNGCGRPSMPGRWVSSESWPGSPSRRPSPPICDPYAGSNANSRLIALAGGQVRFRWKDYRHPQRPKVMTLPVSEFIRRFLLHVLPDGFRRIRHFGFLANAHRRIKLADPRLARSA